MCGRFHVDENTIREIGKIVEKSDDPILKRITGDVYPSQRFPVIMGARNGLLVKSLKWGLPVSYSKQLLINARAETALSKKIFSKGLLTRRCVILAKHFYEWDKSKNKVTFSTSARNTMYIAGFCVPYENEERFIILTTKANECVRPVHDRMPLILSKDELRSWIYDNSRVAEFLKKSSPELVRYQEYEQLSFQFDMEE